MEQYFQRFGRFWELDFLRGMAVIAMIAFHFFFDMNYFAGAGFLLNSGIYFLLAKFVQLSFITLVGISLTISYKRNQEFGKFLKRGIIIFCLGSLITIFTYLFFRQGTIWFGVLHFIGLSIILSYPFLKLKWKNVFWGIIFILLGICLLQFSFPFPFLLWLGFSPQAFYTFDYFPLLPWFGVVLMGIFLGNVLYTNKKRNFRLFDFSNSIISKSACFLGRHSLAIYFLHQPFMVAAIYLFVLR
jgi:uncharacterized membrane protein